MQTKTSQRESLLSRIVALFVAFVLATSFVNLGAIEPQKAWADDEGLSPFVVDSSIVELIGVTGEDGLGEESSIFYGEAPQGTSEIVFSCLTGLDEAEMIAAIASNSFVMENDRITINDSFLVDEETVVESLGIDEGIVSGIDFSEGNIYCFWLTDSDYEMYFYLLKIPAESQPVEETGLPFSILVAGDAVSADKISSVEGGYSYSGYSGLFVKDLYTVAIPAGTTDVELVFDQHCLVYNYGKSASTDNDYIAGWVDDYMVGVLSGVFGVDADKNNVADYLQVQTPYDESNYSELLYAITFEFESDDNPENGFEPAANPPFSVSAAGASISKDSFSVKKDGYTYSYNDYYTGQDVVNVVDLYKVVVPAGTAEVELSFTENCLVYNYDQNPSTNADYLDGWVDNYTTGAAKATVAVDASDPANGPDFIHVQNPYGADSDAGKLLYAITFELDGPTNPVDPVGPVKPGSIDTAKNLPILYDNLAARASSSVATASEYGSGELINFALGLGSSAKDVSGLKAAFASDEANGGVSVGRLGKYITAFSAAGVDCRTIVINGQVRNLVDELKATYAKAVAPVDVACVLPALDMYPADCADEAAAVLNKALGIDWANRAGGYQATAQGILALACHKEAASVVEAAVEALKKVQNADGGFSEAAGEKSNIDTTAAVLTAFAAIGVNADTVVSAEGKSAVDFLVAAADEDLKGYTKAIRNAEPLAAATVYMGLSAYKNHVNVFNARFEKARPQIKIDTQEAQQEQITSVTGLNEALDAVMADPEFAGQTIKSIELKISDKEVSEKDAAAIKELAGNCDGLLLFDVSLIAVTDEDTVDIGGKAYSMIGFTCAFDFAGKDNIKVFRVHDGKAVELPSEPNKDGYFKLDKENGSITIYSTVFSSFGISYDKVATQDADPSVSAKTSDPMDVAPLAVLALGSLVTLCMATRRLNGSAE